MRHPPSTRRRSPWYLPDIDVPATVEPSTDLDEALHGYDRLVALAAPALREALVGIEAPGAAEPGGTILVDLFLSGREEAPAPIELMLRLVAPDGGVVSAVQAASGPSFFPPPRWMRDERVRQRMSVPAGGASGVSTVVQPTVTFSEPMDSDSILPASVRMLNDSGDVVAQAAGYPVLSADGLTATLKPASALVVSHSYRVQVQGGEGGVQDRAGNPLVSDWSAEWTTGATTSSMDLEGPIVSGVAPGSVGSTSIQLGWQTDELSTSQVKPVFPLDSRPTFCARRETIKRTSVCPTVCGEPSTGCGYCASPLKRTTPDSASIRRMDKAALPRSPTCTVP